MTAMPAPARALDAAEQLDLDLDGTALLDTTFCVVDLETTGGGAADGRITEIGAVKVRGGEVIGDFQTFVNPGQPIPAFITVLTGINDRMVADAPREDVAVPLLLDFMAGAVFVAHNAPYDSGFIKAACQRLGLTWPAPQVLDTARLSRSVLGKDEVPNHKLATLAQYFRATVTPTHRALDDARATVDVLHGLIERLGTSGVLTLEELSSSVRKVPRQRRDKRHLADRLPHTCGVYVFRDAHERPLYVGVSSDIRRRVRSYFTSAEQRPRMNEMVGIAASVTAIECATDLEARIRELRLIAQWKPPYNRRSRHPEKAVWLKLTTEAFPRLSVVSRVTADEDAGATYLGPYSSRTLAQEAAEAITAATGLRACVQKLRPGVAAANCILQEIGSCIAPCSGGIGVDEYEPFVAAARQAVAGQPWIIEAPLRERMDALAAEERFEQAATWRDRLAQAVDGIESASVLRVFGQIEQIVAAKPRAGGWDIHVVRHGRLAGADFCPTSASARRVVDACVAAAEDVARPAPPNTATLIAESRMLLKWLADARPVDVAGTWALPVRTQPSTG